MLTLSALAASNLAAPMPSHADGYSGPNYSGGMMTINGTSYPYSGGGGGASDVHSVSCSGSITATFPWMGTSTNYPQSVIVVQTASASAGGLSQGYMTAGDPTAACADGLGDTATIMTTYPAIPPPPSTPDSEQKSGSVMKTEYTVQSGTNPITLICSPSASATVPMPQGTASASVSYSAVIYPVTISLAGTTLDSQNVPEILVGQPCLASLACGAPGTISGWHWSVPDTTFQSWSVSSPPTSTSYTKGPGTLTNSTASWYWNIATATTETVSCSATYTAPDGTTLAVTATQNVRVKVPIYKNSYGSGGSMFVDAHCPKQTGIFLYAGPLSGKVGGTQQVGGMNWQLEADTPTSPAFGSGMVEMVQIITTGASFYKNATTLPTAPKQGQRYVSVDNGMPGLDTSYPYNLSTASGVMAAVGTSDSPALGLDSTVYSASLTSSFNDYLMYMPPAASNPPQNMSPMWVPIATFAWSTSGNATIPTDGNWAHYTGSPGSVSPTNSQVAFSAGSSFPTWTALYSANDNYMPQ